MFGIKWVLEKLGESFLPKRLELLKNWQKQQKRLFVIVVNNNDELCLLDIHASEEITTALQNSVSADNTMKVYRQEHLFKILLDVKKEDLYEIIPTRQVMIDSSISDLADFALSQGINYKILKIHNPWLRDKKLENKTKKIYIIEILTSSY